MYPEVPADYDADLYRDPLTADERAVQEAEYRIAEATWEGARAAGEPMSRGAYMAPLYEGDDLHTAA